MKIFIDIETGDPDDIFALIYMLGIDDFEIVGIAIHPGSQKQIELVKFILGQFNKDIPIGSYNYNKKLSLSKWYLKAFGEIPTSEAKYIDAHDLMLDKCDENTILFSGGTIKNFAKIFTNEKFRLKAWFAQGGFAGINIVPDEYVLPKFKNKVTCSTCNFGTLNTKTNVALESKNVPIKFLCSKNVCHNVYYNDELHGLVAKYLLEHENNKTSNKYVSLKMIYQAMQQGYPNKKNKKMHDLLPALCIRNVTICQWKQIKPFIKQDKTKIEWGSNLDSTSNTFISINYDKDKYIKYFLN